MLALKKFDPDMVVHFFLRAALFFLCLKTARYREIAGILSCKTPGTVLEMSLFFTKNNWDRTFFRKWFAARAKFCFARVLIQNKDLCSLFLLVCSFLKSLLRLLIYYVSCCDIMWKKGIPNCSFRYCSYATSWKWRSILVLHEKKG